MGSQIKKLDVKKCHSCDEEISKNAKICRFCNSKQGKFSQYIDNIKGFGTLIIPFASLMISIAAFYFSRIPEPTIPRLVIQIDRFAENEFSFFIANLGELPTVVRNFDLIIMLAEGEGTRTVSAVYSLAQGQIDPSENRFIEVKYKDYLQNQGRWVETENLRNDPFSLQFLYAASLLGSNLHCELNVHFTSQRYFPSNTDSASASVNGICIEAMKWFAENLGPLREGNVSD